MVKEEIEPKPNTPLSSTKQSSSTKKKPPSHAKQKAKQTGKHITFRIPDLDTKIMRPDFATTVPENLVLMFSKRMFGSTLPTDVQGC